MTRQIALSMALGVSVLVAACGDGGKGPAQAALTAAASAFDTAKAGAAPYVPDQVKSVEDALAAAQATFAKGEYMQALTEAQGLTPKISALAEAAAAKKADLAKTWGALSTDLPGAVSAIQGRLSELAKTRRLPTGITAETIAGAKSGLESLTAAWTDAQRAFGSGNLMEAVTNAQDVKGKLAGVMGSLGMQVPDSLK